ncbi:MAG: sigma-54 dependent transcriptional regulator [Nitrospiraceae bacterium]|nr:sigma-54 dependent transcriptional regulator [Nitrospiraceae bacterium]
MEKILIVEDEINILRLLGKILRQEGFNVEAAKSFEEAVSKFASGPAIDLVLSDMRLPGRSGLDLLNWVKEQKPDLPVIIMTAYGSIENAVQAMRAGAANYLTKPVESGDLLAVVKHSLLHKKPETGNEIAREEKDQYGIIGKSAAIQEILETIRIISDSRSHVLITGESGTGKELVARAIHNDSRRKNFRFVAINCGAIPGELMENELFGHEAGSYTGAASREIGKAELAANGTLFLDEVGEMPPPMQIKFLRFIQEKEFYRIGGTSPVRADCRIVASTNRDLEEEITCGGFREDLFYRLNVIPVQMPRLKDRTEDIPLLAEYFLKKYAGQNQKFIKGIDHRAMEALMAYDWPGNIRQLQNIIERAVVLTGFDTIVPSDLPKKILMNEGQKGQENEKISGLENMKLPEIERAAILGALEAEEWNQTRASSRLGITRRQLRTKMVKYNLL